MSDAGALSLRGVEASYGPVQVLFGIDLEVPAGARLALLGTNGAGKSTVLRVAAGLLPADAGTVHIHGRDVTEAPTEARAAAGLGLVVGGKALFPSMTVRENLAIGGNGVHVPGSDAAAAALEEVLGLFPALRPRLDQAAGTLSGGEAQMVAIGRALVAGPSVLCIDELSLGLAPAVVGQVVEVVDAVAETGVTLVVVEQSLHVAGLVCDDAVFLEKGEVRFRGPTAELVERGDLARAVFFGRD